MSSWRHAVANYIQLRRSVGFQLRAAEVALGRFAAFLDARGAAHLTSALALQWAQQDPTAHPVTWAQRLGFVRGFARHWSAQDPHTEVPRGACSRTGRAARSRTCTAMTRCSACSRPRCGCPRSTVCAV